MGGRRLRLGAILLAAGLAAGAAAAPGSPSTAGASGTPGVPGPPQDGHRRDGFRARFLGKPAPDFDLTDIHGRPVRLSRMRGKVVLLNFWYSSCLPCRRETPDLMTLHRLHERDGLEILGVNLDDILIPEAGHEPLHAFLNQFPIPYPVVLADSKVFHDYGEIPVQPISFLVDRAGTIVHVFWGAFSGSVFEKAVRPYLAPPARPGP